ncbi:MAG: uncharacterized protein JWR28_514 [Modestobacter sp.]|nr:uncharacterized protein [Modestobacter sp.]MCW2617365.1 uncharacterized protein [Modestobacter sp.]
MRATRTRLAVVGLAVLLTAGCGSDQRPAAHAAGSSTPAAAPTTETAPPTPTQLELPGGGTQVFPGRRLIGFSGAPSSAALGPMTGDLAAAAEQLRQQAVPYGADRAVLPTFELIATTAHPTPGPAGTYATSVDDAVVQQYLDAARAAGAILLLGIQPGTGDFLPAVQHYERWLTEPDVGVALDPEWAVDAGEVPGDVFGSTTGAELDSISAYLDGLVTAHRLPQKVMVYHQLHADIVSGQEALLDRPGVAVVKSVDGIGAAADKVATYQRVIVGTPPFVHIGFKLFYEEDTRSGPLMTPEEVLALVPQPEYVLYE